MSEPPGGPLEARGGAGAHGRQRCLVGRVSAFGGSAGLPGVRGQAETVGAGVSPPVLLGAQEDLNTGYTGAGPQVMATLRNLAISILHLNGITEMTGTLQRIRHDRARVLDILIL